MEEATVRERAGAFCAALVAGDVELAAHDLSEELHRNLGQLVAMLPMPLTAASVELADRTASGMRLVLRLAGETESTQLETRWKERDGRPVIVEVSHLAATPAPAPAQPDMPATPGVEGSENPAG